MFNIDEVIREMVGVMRNNYENKASNQVKFNWAKKDLIERFAEVIEDNREEIIKDFNNVTE